LERIRRLSALEESLKSVRKPYAPNDPPPGPYFESSILT
jgi:hypothetical protein